MKKIIRRANERGTANHGVYVMVISGEITIENEVLSKHDTIQILQTNSINSKSVKNSELLFIKVPTRCAFK